MRKTFRLSKSSMMDLEPGEKIYVTTWVSDGILFAGTPALVASCDEDELVFIYIGDDAEPQQGRLPVGSYGKTWSVDVDDGFLVETPDGILHASPTRDEEFPGVSVDLFRPGDDIRYTRLAMTEYTSGGEGLCGFDPSDPAWTRAEIAEVPVERIETEDGRKVTSKAGIRLANAGKYRVAAGLLTRAWPDDTHDDERHVRVFHIGYEEETK